MSSVAFRTALRMGLRTVSRQATLSVPRIFATPARTFSLSSTLLNKPSLTAANTQLADVLKSEINLEVETEEPIPEVVNDYLSTSGFQVVEKEGLDEVELVKKVGNETVHVFFSVSDITNGNPEQFFEEENAEAEEEELAEDLSPIRANIVIEKAGSALGVECVVQHAIIMIESITPYPSGEAALANTVEADYKRREIYQGPSFDNLDESVQSSFETYLEARGINSELADFIAEYSSYRENKEYLNWLKKFRTFVEA